MCVDLSDYNRYLNQIWYRTQIPHYQHADDTLLQTGLLGNQTSLQIVPIESKRKKVKIILRRDRDISKDLSCK